MSETALIFDCQGDSLVGILHAPEMAAQTGVLVVVGGPQYRGGSHRQFVQLARRLAAAGVAVLRFDVRGMGDSSGTQRSFEQLDDDIAAALRALHKAQPQLRRVVLWGLCDGASAALLYLQRCPNVAVDGLVLLNPWVRSTTSLARTHVKHYYLQRLMQREFWAKLLSGRVAGRALAELARNLRRALGGAAAANAGASDMPFQQAMAQAWSRFKGPVLLVLSGKDYTAKEFIEHANADERWRRNLALPGVTRVDVAEADHTFAEPAAQATMEAAMLRWLDQAGPDLPTTQTRRNENVD